MLPKAAEMQSGSARPQAALLIHPTRSARGVSIRLQDSRPLSPGPLNESNSLGSPATHARNGLAGLGALAAQLAVLLDLAPDVLGEGVDRVEHLG